MFGRIAVVLPIAIGMSAQDEAAMALLRKADATAHDVTSWRAEAVEVSELSGNGMNIRNEIHIKIAAKFRLR